MQFCPRKDNYTSFFFFYNSIVLTPIHAESAAIPPPSFLSTEPEKKPEEKEKNGKCLAVYLSLVIGESTAFMLFGLLVNHSASF